MPQNTEQFKKCIAIPVQQRIVKNGFLKRESFITTSYFIPLRTKGS